MGSSPRVRGKPTRSRVCLYARGLIPACAGKTPRQDLQEVRAWAHPRVCGENASISTRAIFKMGSSPRVRGKPQGLIVQFLSAKAHPRVCGENLKAPPRMSLIRGSSPRVRGKPVAQLAQTLGLGLIPACAGKTCLSQFLLQRSWAHPRVCGENIYGKLKTRSPQGSSPRVRGKLASCVIEERPDGLIPACAGKTRSRRLTNILVRAHPRVCGENKQAQIDAKAAEGSSPRVRGKRVLFVRCWLRVGLIPACAGKTAVHGFADALSGAHPRVCGENLLERRARAIGAGSSPRVRGKH